MPSQVVCADPDDPGQLALHTVNGKTTGLGGDTDRLILYSDDKYDNFVAFCQKHGTHKLVNTYEGEGITFSHGSYVKSRGAETRLKDALNLLDQGWGTRSLSADFSVPNPNNNKAAATWNAIQKGVLALTSPSNAAALVAELSLTVKRYYVMISASPTTTGLRGEFSRTVFGGVPPQAGVKPTVTLLDVANALQAKRAGLTEQELEDFKNLDD